MAVAGGDLFVANSDLNGYPGTSVPELCVWEAYRTGEPWPSSGGCRHSARTITSADEFPGASHSWRARPRAMRGHRQELVPPTSSFVEPDVEPEKGIEPLTYALRVRCSAV